MFNFLKKACALILLPIEARALNELNHFDAAKARKLYADTRDTVTDALTAKIIHEIRECAPHSQVLHFCVRQFSPSLVNSECYEPLFKEHWTLALRIERRLTRLGFLVVARSVFPDVETGDPTRAIILDIVWSENCVLPKD